MSSRFRCPDTKTEIQRLITTHFRPPNQNYVNSDPYAEINSDHPHNQTHFNPKSEINSSSTPRTEIKLVSTTHTKTKSKSMFTPKPSDFRPAFKNHVNFDHPHKTKSIDPHTKNKPLSSAHKKQVNFDLYTKRKYFSARTPKAVDFEPGTKSKSVWSHTLKPSLFLFRTQKLI